MVIVPRCCPLFLGAGSAGLSAAPRPLTPARTVNFVSQFPEVWAARQGTKRQGSDAVEAAACEAAACGAAACNDDRQPRRRVE
jgi:hypothetical protein